LHLSVTITFMPQTRFEIVRRKKRDFTHLIQQDYTQASPELYPTLFVKVRSAVTGFS